MIAATQASVRNRLLRALPVGSFDRLRPCLELVDLPLRTVLVEWDEGTAAAYFLESGFASMVTASDAGRAKEVEVGHIGDEGFSGVHLALEADQTPNRTFMQIKGQGYRIRAADLAEAMDRDAALRGLLLRYVATYHVQMAQTVLAASRNTVHQRLARWLLMCHDRTQGNDLPLTHDVIALMLGVRRSGVTDAIHVLEGMRAIVSTRGLVRIRDRQMLEDVAAESYGVPERQYADLIGAAPPRAAVLRPRFGRAEGRVWVSRPACDGGHEKARPERSGRAV